MNMYLLSLLFCFMTRYTVFGSCDCNDCLESGVNCQLCPAERGALECNARGDLICGQCTCHHGYSGVRCQIIGATNQSTDDFCIRPTSSVMCSGKGDCIAGMCQCHARTANSAQRYSGQYCQCDDYSCPHSNDRLCGGPERGICQCKVCECFSGYTGDGCDCVQSNATCISRNSGRICNGYGDCVCGKCKCDKDSEMRGPTCDDCMTCHDYCRRAWPCLQCKFLRQGPYNAEECLGNCTQYDYDVIPVVNELQPGLQMCTFKSYDECIYEFGYSFDQTDQVHFQIKLPGECPPRS